MRVLKIISLTVSAIVLLLVIAFVVMWTFNPLAPDVVVDDPAPHGHRIDEGSLIANFYPVDKPGTHPAILLLGGSEGGIGSTRMAQALQKENYAVLALSYFGAPEQPKTLELIQLELFDQAIAWLASQPDIDSDKLAVIGTSKGAEAALIIATRHPELRAVTAGMPSSVAWQGYDPNLLKQIFTPPDGSWSLGGEPIPFLPYVRDYVDGPLELYEKSLAEYSNYPEASIPIEMVGAPILLVCGELDAIWPSCDMARQIKERATKRQGPDVTILAYEKAGHAGFGVPLKPDHSRFSQLGTIGGTAEDNNSARIDSWAKTLEYLRAAFEVQQEHVGN